MIQMARLRGCKVMCYAHGFGPLKLTKSRKLAKFVMNQVQMITFRDEKSKLTASGFGVNKPPVHVTADPVFALSPAPDKTLRPYMDKLEFHPSIKKVGISVRPWPCGINYVEVVATVADRIINELGAQVYLFPFQHSQDMRTCRDLLKKMKIQRGVTLVEDEMPVTVLTGLMSKMDMIVGMRLHSLIFAASAGVPAVGISYDPKVSSIMDQVGLSWLDVNKVDMDNLWQACHQTFRDLDHVRQRIKPNVDKLEKNARANTRFMMDILK